MTAPYSEKYKMEVLFYARDNGVMAAMRHYGLPHATITRWNKARNVYTTKTSQYRPEQRIKILKYAAINGKRRAAKKFGVSVGSIDLWDKEFKIIGRRQKHFTLENKIEILTFARDFSPAAAADKFDVLQSQIVDWNKTLHVYNLRRPYTKAEKIKILCYARDYGVTAAEREFNVPKNTMQRWNRELHIYNERKIPQYRRCGPEEQIQLLKRAKEIYDKMPADQRSAQQAFISIEEEYDVTRDQLRKWNIKHKIVPLRARAKRKLSQAEIDAAQDALIASRGRVTAAARQAGMTAEAITRLKKNKIISFQQAKKNITTRPPVGKNKSKTITAIISGLLKAKSKE